MEDPKELLEAAKYAVSDPCEFTEMQIESLHKFADLLDEMIQAKIEQFAKYNL
jgi:hypothetical protein